MENRCIATGRKLFKTWTKSNFGHYSVSIILYVLKVKQLYSIGVLLCVEEWNTFTMIMSMFYTCSSSLSLSVHKRFLR